MFLREALEPNWPYNIVNFYTEIFMWDSLPLIVQCAIYILALLIVVPVSIGILVCASMIVIKFLSLLQELDLKLSKKLGIIDDTGRRGVRES